MKADDIAYRNNIHALSREELEEECFRQKQEADHNRILYQESQKSLTATSKDYMKTATERDELKTENIKLHLIIQKMEANQTLGQRDRFGSKGESLEDLLSSSQEDPENPVDEDAADDDGEESESGKSNGNVRNRALSLANPDGKKHGTGKKGGLEEMLKRLPQMVEYEFDPAALDKEFGEFGWVIAYWHSHYKVETRRSVRYVRVIKTAVLSICHGDKLVTLPFLYPLFIRSILTPSTVAAFLYNKFFLHLPFYRQEEDMRQTDGFAISRQTMIRWAIRLACVFLWRVYEHMCLLEADCRYQNADETYLRVITEEGSKPGKKYYVWVFSTGELMESHPIIVYRYGPSRSADNIREQLGIRDYLRMVTCDSYVAYSTAENESDGKISLSHCLSHARRRWVYALEVLHPGKYTDEQLAELPEVKALLLIQEVFNKDTPLKRLSADERQKRRDTEVRPLMKAYLDFVHSLDPEDLSLSEKARDAITYTINQESYLTKFLDDGNIPIDNSFAERNVKTVALGRRNWLFADTPEGAKTICVFDTFVATAKANHANVYYYLKYLIEKAPLIPEDKTQGEELLSDLMPWSEAYKKYEKDQIQKDASLVIGGEEPPRPKTPRKKDKKQCA